MLTVFVTGASAGFGAAIARRYHAAGHRVVATARRIDRLVRLAADGLVFCTRAILPGMVERRRGHIVNLGSIAGTYPYPGGNVYAGV